MGLLDNQVNLGEELQVFEGDKATQSRGSFRVMGLAFVALGLCLRWIPPLYTLLGKTMTESQLTFFTNIGWIILLVIGFCVFVGALRATKLLEVVLYKGGLSIKTNKQEEAYAWAEIKAILDYSRKQGDVIEIRFQNNRKSIFIEKKKLTEYDACAQSLQQAHSSFILGREFPENIKTLQISFGKELSLVNGEFYHKRKAVRFEDIKSYTFAKTRPLYNSYDVYIRFKNGGQVSIFAQDVENRYSLLQVLAQMAPEAKV